MARSRPPTAPARRPARSSSSSAPSVAARSGCAPCTRGQRLGAPVARRRRSPGPGAPSGARPGSPSSRTPMAATRSSRSSARSVRSSLVSGSDLRWVCTSRRPRRRTWPARARPMSGSSSLCALPTITCSTSPLRLSSTPTWRFVSQRELGEVPGQLGADDLVRGDPAAVGVAELLQLAGLEAQGVPEDVVQGVWRHLARRINRWAGAQLYEWPSRDWTREPALGPAGGGEDRHQRAHQRHRAVQPRALRRASPRSCSAAAQDARAGGRLLGRHRARRGAARASPRARRTCPASRPAPRSGRAG